MTKQTRQSKLDEATDNETKNCDKQTNDKANSTSTKHLFHINSTTILKSLTKQTRHTRNIYALLKKCPITLFF